VFFAPVAALKQTGHTSREKDIAHESMTRRRYFEISEICRMAEEVLDGSLLSSCNSPINHGSSFDRAETN
jgi:hypothetical protein